MSDNPWQVESIDAFMCLKCPECLFDTKEAKNFQNHALENHPMSFVLFGKKDKDSIEFNESLQNEGDICQIENSPEGQTQGT